MKYETDPEVWFLTDPHVQFLWAVPGSPAHQEIIRNFLGGKMGESTGDIEQAPATEIEEVEEELNPAGFSDDDVLDDEDEDEDDDLEDEDDED